VLFALVDVVAEEAVTDKAGVALAGVAPGLVSALGHGVAAVQNGALVSVNALLACAGSVPDRARRALPAIEDAASIVLERLIHRLAPLIYRAIADAFLHRLCRARRRNLLAKAFLVVPAKLVIVAALCLGAAGTVAGEAVTKTVDEAAELVH
jgi:hypothetical protein